MADEIVIYAYESSSKEHKYCEKRMIKQKDGLDPQYVLDISGSTECWKCGAML